MPHPKAAKMSHRLVKNNNIVGVELEAMSKPVMWFGKHHGQRFDELDEHYLNAMLNQYEGYPDDRNASLNIHCVLVL